MRSKDLLVARKCQRKAAISSSLVRCNQTGLLEKIILKTFRNLEYAFDAADKNRIKNALMHAYSESAGAQFDASGIITSCRDMLVKVANAEFQRQLANIERYCDYEKKAAPGITIAEDIFEEVEFAGELVKQRIDRLIERTGICEAIVYVNAAPKRSSRGRNMDTSVSMDASLAVIQLAAEKYLKSARINVRSAFVQPAYYHMKSADDSSKSRADEFNKKSGSNIAAHRFTAEEIKDLEKIYQSSPADITKKAHSLKECKDCTLNLVCGKDQFVYRKEEGAECVEVKPLNSFSLTDTQKNFVTDTEDDIRVNAVAGAGKTMSLVLKIFYLIETGVPEDKILVLTFCSAAAKEIKERLEAYSKGVYKFDGIRHEDIPVFTYNGFGQMLIEKHYEKLKEGFKAPPVLVDSITKRDIIVDLWQNAGLDFGSLDANPFMNLPSCRGSVMQLTNVIDTMKAAHVTTEKEAASCLDLSEDAAKDYFRFYEEYNKTLFNRGMIDYEDQLRLLNELASLGVFKEMEYQHIIIDEFQDSNANQIDIIASLRNDCPSVKTITVVGDDLQAIYGFRNATPANFTGLKKYFPGLIDVRLDENFRSAAPIITGVNKIIQRIGSSSKKISSKGSAEGKEPAVLLTENQEEEIRTNVKAVKEFLESGLDAKDIAVLCRTKPELLEYKDAFEKEGIPAVLKVPQAVKDSPWVKAIISLCRFLRDSSNTADLAVFMSSSGKDAFDKDSFKNEFERIKGLFEGAADEKEKVNSFFDLIKNFREDYIADFFISELEKKGFRTLSEIIEYCCKYELYQIEETLPSSKAETNAVTLTTVHSAKGLEWKNVIVNLRKFKTGEEEKRLFYVAASRAKENLTVTYTHKVKHLASLMM